ncbi:alpha/beta fold hydrolase [Enterovibrio nigricans]|uniref:Esterase n=1 Tax=Enterovibrio nigricans DSM 22720 TaxID=1121868 RepID=A0A1T4V2Z1_9GAMM|nr:alpha/beta fold hydrolase [Enterovibrio nigricans]PKF50515.1 alpha/beta hydrolase [Enterovibrio nigricans]SKA59288.1 esterase [Enterovibrio nigricans DSM 22720]
MFLNFKIQGNGEPLLLIHGLFGSLDNLGGLARVLAEQYKVYQIDLPNHGLSPRSLNVDYVSQAAAVMAFLDQQDLTCVSVVGHSMGGKVAMMLATQYPDRIKQLVVMDIAPVSYQVRRHDNVFAGLNASKQLPLRSRKEAEAKLAEHIVDPGVRQFLLKSLARQEDGTFDWRFNVDTLEANYEDITGWTKLDQFGGSTLFLKGSESDYISAEHRGEIEAQFPNAKAHVVANTGHWLHAEKPETVARVITRFLTKSVR